MRKRKKFRLKNIRKLLCFCFPTGKRALPNDWECLENGQYCCFSEITSNDLRNCVLDTLEALCQEEIVSEDKEKTNRPRQWVPRLGVNTSRIQFPNGKRSAPNDSDSLDDEQYSCFSETCSNDGKNHLVETLAALCQQVIVSEATENAYCSGPWIPRRRSLEFSINAIDPAAVLIFIPHDVLVPRPLWTYPMYQQYDFPDSIITCPRNACRTVSCLYGLSPSAWYLALCLWHHYTTSFSQIKACRHSTDICLSALSVLNMFMSIVCQMDDSKVVKTTVSEGQAILEITITTSPTHPELFKALFGRLFCFKNTVTHPLVQGVNEVAVQNIDIREDAYGDIHLHAIVYPASRQQSVRRRAVVPRFVVRKFALRRSMVRRSTVRRSTLQRSIQALPDVRENSIDIPRQHTENDLLDDVIRGHCLRYDIRDIRNDLDNQEHTHDHSINLETSLEIATVMDSIIDKIDNHEIAADVINSMHNSIDIIDMHGITADIAFSNIIDDENSSDNIVKNKKMDNDTSNEDNDVGHVHSSIDQTGFPIHSHSFSSLLQHNSSSDVINIEYDKAIMTSQEVNNGDACNVICQDASKDDDSNGDSATINANKQDVTVDFSTCSNGNDGHAYRRVDHSGFPVHSQSFSSLVQQSSDVINIEYDKTTVTSQESNNDDDCNVICQEASEEVSEDDEDNGDSATIRPNTADVIAGFSTCPNVNNERAYSSFDHADFSIHPHGFSSLVSQNSSSDVISLLKIMPARRAPLTKIHPKAMLQAASDPPPQIDHINGVMSHADVRETSIDIPRQHTENDLLDDGHCLRYNIGNDLDNPENVHDHSSNMEAGLEIANAMNSNIDKIDNHGIIADIINGIYIFDMHDINADIAFSKNIDDENTSDSIVKIKMANDISNKDNDDRHVYSSIDHTCFPIHSHGFSSLLQHNSSSDVINIEYDNTIMPSQEVNNGDACNVTCHEASKDDDNNGDSATINANKQDVIADLSTCPNGNDGRAHCSIDHTGFPIHSHSFSSLVPQNSSSDVISLVAVMPARRAPLTKIHPKAMLQAASDPPPQIDHTNGVTSHADISLNDASVNGSVSSTMHDIPEKWTSNRYEEPDNQSTTDLCKNDQGDMLVPKLCNKDTYKLSCDSSAETSPIFLSRIVCQQITQNPASTAMHHSAAVCICGLAFAMVLDPGRWSEKKLTILLTNAAGVEQAILQKTKKENIDMCDLPVEVNTRFVSLPSGPPSVWLGTKHVISSSIVSSSSHPAHLRSASSHLLSALRLALTLCHNIGAVIVSGTVVHAVMLTKTKQVALLSSCCEEASMCIFNDLSGCANYLKRKCNTSVMCQILPVYKYASCLQHSTRPGNHHKHMLRHQ